MSKSLPILGQDSVTKEEHTEGPGHVPRRDFLLLVFGWIGTVGSLAAASLAGMRGLLPNLLNEPDQRFRAGKPEEYGDGAVSFLAEIRTFLVREDGGFRAMSGVCTHLGCTVNHVGSGYKCPCHGSVFDEQGRVLSGPAPRALDSYALALTRDGRLVVDRGQTVPADDFLVLDTRERHPEVSAEGSRGGEPT